MARSVYLTLVFVPLLAGCSGMVNVETGYAHAIAKNPEEAAFALNANAGLGTGNDTAGAGAGLMLRSKLGPNVQQIAVGPLAFGAVGSMHGKVPYAFYGIAGVHLLQVDNVHRVGQDWFSFGSLSPVTEIGLSLPGQFLTMAVAGEYDLRFSDVPNTGYVSFLVGFGAVGFSKGL